MKETYLRINEDIGQGDLSELPEVCVGSLSLVGTLLVHTSLCDRVQRKLNIGIP